MAASNTKSFIRARLKTRQIALLVHLDDERSVLRAAEVAGMTQPAASKLLRELEEALAVPLFERHARGVVPTWYGEILVRHARTILSELSHAQDEISALKSGRSGQASIGTVLSPGTDLIPMAIGLLKQGNPGMQITVDLNHSKALIEKLLQGNLDMVVGRILDSQGAEELQFEPLADERHALIAGARHPLAGRHNLHLEDLTEQSWILPTTGSVLRNRLVARFLARGLPVPSNVVETSSMPVITSLLRTTDMVVVLPETAVQSYCQAGVLTVLIKDVGVDIGLFGIVTRRRHQLSPGAQVLLAALREAASRLYPATPTD